MAAVVRTISLTKGNFRETCEHANICVRVCDKRACRALSGSFNFLSVQHSFKTTKGSRCFFDQTNHTAYFSSAPSLWCQCGVWGTVGGRCEIMVTNRIHFEDCIFFKDILYIIQTNMVSKHRLYQNNPIRTFCRQNVVYYKLYIVYMV